MLRSAIHLDCLLREREYNPILQCYLGHAGKFTEIQNLTNSILSICLNQKYFWIKLSEKCPVRHFSMFC